ncbi:MAG TPA: alpha/beta fold hydrolase [Pseudonocardiaceae bacterium]|jgi:lipase|nr:alpha/beta fold hydrolase [Pseudonocardiaceae bacterium]
MVTMVVPLHVHEFGPADGVPLLALHGLTGHGARWRALAETNLRRFRVIAPDLRGHGRSTPLPPWSLEQHAADLLAIIDSYRLDAVPVLAHSFGAAVGLHLQRLAPGRVSRLILLDPAAGLNPQLALDRATAVPRLFNNQQEAFAAQRSDWPIATDAEIGQELAEHLEQVDGRFRFRYCPPAAATAWSEMARTAVLPGEGTPTMLVRALGSDFVNDALVNACRTMLGSDFELVDLDCGHMVYLERPHDVGALVNNFVARG